LKESPFSLARAEREAGDHCAVEFAPNAETAGGSFTFAELARAGAKHGAKFDQRSPRRPLGLVTSTDAETVTTLFAALDREQPLLLLHPLAPESARKSVETKVAQLPLPQGAQLLLETSGSTGAPRWVVHGANSLAAAARASAANLGWAPQGDRWLLSLPLSHVGGLSILLRCFLGRQTAVIAPLPTNSPKRARAELERLDISLVSLVPTQLARLLEDPDFSFPSRVRLVLIGGARLTDALRRRAVERGVPLVSTYGMTEFCSQICTEKPGEPGAGVGPPLPGTDVRLLPDGRIQVRGPTACLGYLGRPSPFDAEGWFTTSDRGHWDESGHLHVLGRTDCMIISGGENVHPETVEAELLALPEVRAAGVVGIPDEEWGQRIVAGVVLVPSARALSASALEKRWREELRQKLPSFALPKSYVRLDELPLLGIGKLDRAALLELLMR